MVMNLAVLEIYTFCFAKIILHLLLLSGFDVYIFIVFFSFEVDKTIGELLVTFLHINFK